MNNSTQPSGTIEDEDDDNIHYFSIHLQICLQSRKKIVTKFVSEKSLSQKNQPARLTDRRFFPMNSRLVSGDVNQNVVLSGESNLQMTCLL